MKYLALIAVRLGSSRLPGKALLPILDKPMLERMIERIRQSKYINDIAIATTTNPEDQELEEFADSVGVHCFRGSVDDVLGRINAAVDHFKPEHVVELLGDNPLVHSELIDTTIEHYQQGGYDYTATVTDEYPDAPADCARFPIGIRVQVFSAETLRSSARQATSLYNREHSTSYIFEHPEQYKIGYLEANGPWAPLNRPKLTFAVNYRQNYELIGKLFEECYPKDRNFSLKTVVQVFDARKDLASLMGEPQLDSTKELSE